MLLDSCASVSGLSEEAFFLMLEYWKETGMLKDEEHDLHPIRKIDRYIETSSLNGITKGELNVRYGISLRAEFVPVNQWTCAKSGPCKWPHADIYFKIFPKGTSGLMHPIISFPVLDTPPHGLGWIPCEGTHYFRQLDVYLPRCELGRRAARDKGRPAAHPVRIAPRKTGSWSSGR